MSEPMRTPDDVLATMATQRAAGWPDWHPEDYCHRCGGRNASWHVDSDRFNAAMGPPTLHRWNGIICPGCFVELHEAATGLTATWTLSPDTPFRHIDPEPDVSDVLTRSVLSDLAVAVAETNRQTDTSRLSDFDGGDTPFDGAAADRRLRDMRRGLPTSADVAGLWADEPVRACGPYCGCNDDKEQL